MAVEIEGLEFQIEAKSENAAKGVDALINSFNKLKAATKGGAGLNNISKKLDAISNAKLSMSGIEKIEDLTKSLNSLSNVKISSTISKRLTEIGASLDSLDLSGVEKIEALSTALQNMQGIQIPNMRNITGNQTATPTGTAAPADPAGAINAGAAATAATSGITQYTSQITAAATQTRGFLGVLQGVGGVFSRAFSAVGGVALKAFQAALKGVSTAAKSAVNACKKLGSTIGSKLSSKVKQTTSGMGQLFSSLKRIALYRAIRFFFAQLTAAMKEGIQNLYMYSSLMGGTFKGSMDSLATSFQYLKNSMGAMVAPLINMIAPAVDALIDKFAALLNIVNQFFARLSGATTFTKAKKAAASYGDSISGAGKSAKKAAKDIEFTGTAEPYNRIVLNNFAFGDVTDFTMERQDMTSSPKAIKQELVKEVIVPCYSYQPGNAEESLVSEDITVKSGDVETFYVGEPSYNFRATLDESSSGVSITAWGNYYVTVKFSKTGTFRLEILGYRYKIVERYATKSLNSRGKSVKWANPLISDMAIATELAEWIGDYYTAGIEYEYDTRGNPEIDANDIVYQENEFHDGMKVNIYRHTINFDQAFSGKVTARRVSS